tara:strand:- start:649 stop:849 length:201 start_codon:yes stop_codon:yes gene_type:complete
MKKKISNSLRTLILIIYTLGCLIIGTILLLYAFLKGWKIIIIFSGALFFSYLGVVALMLVSDKLKK